MITDNFNTALILMAVGMITVFAILALIVFFGNILIKIVNKYFPEKILEKTLEVSATTGIDPRKIAAITAFVDITTGGMGKVSGISKNE